GLPLCAEHSRQTLFVAKDQFGTLVVGKPAGEPDGQGVGIKQCPARCELRGSGFLINPAISRMFTDESEQISFQRLPRLPQFIVRDGVDVFPEERIILTVSPIRAEVALEKRIHRRSYPGGNMNAVGYAQNGIIALVEN